MKLSKLTPIERIIHNTHECDGRHTGETTGCLLHLIGRAMIHHGKPKRISFKNGRERDHAVDALQGLLSVFKLQHFEIAKPDGLTIELTYNIHYETYELIQEVYNYAKNRTN